MHQVTVLPATSSIGICGASMRLGAVGTCLPPGPLLAQHQPSCSCCRRTPKKISTVTFTADSKWAIFADKFGDVFRGQVQAAANAPAAASGHMAAPVPGTAAHTAGGETEPAGELQALGLHACVGT